MWLAILAILSIGDVSGKLLSVPLTRQERQLLFEPSWRLKYHLEEDSLVGDDSAWSSPVERFLFYVKVLTDIEEQNEGKPRME